METTTNVVLEQTALELCESDVESSNFEASMRELDANELMLAGGGSGNVIF
jgi:hypothetical protein